MNVLCQEILGAHQLVPSVHVVCSEPRDLIVDVMLLSFTALHYMIDLHCEHKFEHCDNAICVRHAAWLPAIGHLALTLDSVAASFNTHVLARNHCLQGALRSNLKESESFG
jgi:hypothetical protein